jgi:hypothetical protein
MDVAEVEMAAVDSTADAGVEAVVLAVLIVGKAVVET